MAENWLTKVARIAIRAAQGLTWTDKNNEVQVVKPEGKSNLINIQKIVDGIGNGGNAGGGDNPDHPSAGADYYAGSLADGEITERELLWQGESDPTKTTNATLLKDVGAKFNMAGDGAFILVHLLKTVMNAGVKGATSEVKLNYDVNNVAKYGYFTTTSPYPIYISAADLATHQELIVPLNGIGENLGGKNFKAPELHITYKDDKTVDISTVTGYNNDGADSGATGANYDAVVATISTFSTQAAVAQLPASVNYFSGLATDDISLTGVSEFYQNTMDGISIKLDTIAYTESTGNILNFDVSELKFPSEIRIPKDQLIIGNSYQIENISLPSTDIVWVKNGNYDYRDYRFKFTKWTYDAVKISKNSININVTFLMHGISNLGQSDIDESFILKVKSISPYKD